MVAVLHRLRPLVDSWRFWVVLAYFIGAGLIIFGGVIYTRESSDRAARTASVQAQYEACIGSVPFTMRINRFLHGVDTVGAVLLLNSVQMHAITPPGSPAYRQQEINIRRLRRALDDQAVVKAFPVPTPASCRAASQRSG